MIINRYIFKEVLISFLGALLVLALVIVGNSFVRLLADASAGQLPADLLAESLMYVSAKNLIKLIPVALLIGMMLAFSRLYRDSEMIAMEAAGVNPFSMYKAIFTFVIPLTIILAVLTLLTNPWLENQYHEVRRQVDERPESAGIPPGTFKTTTSSKGEFTLLAEDIEEDQSTMNRFFVHVKDANGESIIWGKQAALFINSVSGGRILEFKNGTRYEFPNDNSARMIRFEEHGVSVPLKDTTAINKLSALPTLELFQNTTVEKSAEFHWRLAVIISAPLMALLAFPLSHTNPRQGRYSKVALGILIYTLYANALMSGKSFLEQGRIDSWLGLWWVHLLMLGFIYWLIRHYFSRAK